MEELLRYRHARKNKERLNYFKEICRVKFSSSNKKAVPEEEQSKDVDIIAITESTNEEKRRPYLKYAISIIWFAAWAFFIWIEFGLVFTVLSLILLVFLNTRTGNNGNIKQPSAYSVFNEGCNPIEGSIDKEQLDRAFRGQM